MSFMRHFIELVRNRTFSWGVSIGLPVLIPVASERAIVSEMPITVSTPASSSVSRASDGADRFAQEAADLLAREGVAALARYDPHPAPLYAIDAGGRLIYYNEACVAITGRNPQIGVDRWCVAAAIYTPDEEPVDYATGPMATAVREARPLRDLVALIERPDGEKTPVRVFPTPALTEDGRVVGAVNLIVPLDGVLHQELLATAMRCRTLAKWIGDRQANDALSLMAVECDQQARILAPVDPDTPRN